MPLFVFDDALLGTACARPNRVASLLDALRDLDASLTRRGARLVNGDRGVCITFHSPVPCIGRIRRPELTVTVLAVDGLMEAITRRDPG